MSDQGKRVVPTHRRYTPQQKEQAVRLVRKIRTETDSLSGR